MAVEGRYFRPDEDGFRAELIREGKNYRLALGDLTTSTGFEATIPKGLPPGQYDLRVVNPDDQFDFEPAVYESKAATPAPTSTPTLTPTSTLTPTP